MSGITLNHFFGLRLFTGFHHDFKKKSRKKLATVSSDLRCWIIGSYFWRMLVDITISLTFLHCMSNHDAIQLAANRSVDSVHDASTLLGSQTIDTHAPLILYSSLSLILTLYFTFWHQFVDQRLLVLDLLSVHLVRNINGSTIISYHPTLNIPATTAKFLHERISFAGTSNLIIIFILLSNPQVKACTGKACSKSPKTPLSFFWHSYGTPCMHGMRPWKIYMSIFVRWWVLSSCGRWNASWLADRKAAWSQLRKCQLPENFISSELIIFTTSLSSNTIQNMLISSKIHPTLLWMP